MLSPLYESLSSTFLDVCRDSLRTHQDEHFYSVALYTSGEYNYLLDTLSTTEGLEQVARRYLSDDYYKEKWASLDAGMENLKWSPCDSPWHCEFEDRFVTVNEILDSFWASVDDESDEDYIQACQQVHEMCIAVLALVKDSNVFQNHSVVFNLLMGDQSDEERLLNAQELNTDSVLEQYRSELNVDEGQLENLKETRWDI